MINLQDIIGKRWYMGKGRTPTHFEQIDELTIGSASISLVSLRFREGEPDLYLLTENDDFIGPLLYRALGKTVGSKSFRSKKGIFSFVTYSKFGRDDLESLKPISAEQSNSSFVAPGKIFFKIFRRLQAGAHPEEEVLRFLNEQGYQGSPELLASCRYTGDDGKTFVLGILEKHLPDAQNAWDVFTREPTVEKAYELGCETARMHSALREMDGCEAPSEMPPIERLRELLKQGAARFRVGARNDESGDAKGFPDAAGNDELTAVQAILPRLQKIWTETAPNKSAIFKPQRIHGDFHLGQVLMTPDARFKMIDFEGEPTRSLEFRRGLRSPAVDVAGMIRSFAYAEAVSKINMDNVRQAFIQGYAKTASVPEDSLQQELKPYIIAKAIYEACYELEFRPDWFWIPARALIQLANPRE
ncbi:MAG: phosphotransferase [Fibrobacter sp.]|nr:phosphotransferase [Fibrobacter sp.]